MKLLRAGLALAIFAVGGCTALAPKPAAPAHPHVFGDISISHLPPGGTLVGPEQLPAVQSGTTVTTTPTALAAYANSHNTIAAHSFVCNPNSSAAFASACTTWPAVDTSSATVAAIATGAVARSLGSRATDLYNVKDFGAQGNAVSVSGCIFTASSPNLNCPSATWSAADVGKGITVTGAGASAASLATTIASVTDSTHLALAANASTTGNYWRAVGVASTGGTITTNYVPGQTWTCVGGTETTNCQLLVVSTSVANNPTVAAGGSGGTNGTCYVQTTTAVGQQALIKVTIAGGAISAVVNVTNNGYFTTNFTSPAAEPVTSIAYGGVAACGVTGATLNFTATLQPLEVHVPTQGVYSAAPTGTAASAMVPTGGTGAGGTFNVSFEQTGIANYGTDDTAAINFAVAQVNTDFAAGLPRKCIYFPPTTYYTSGQFTRFSQGNPGCVLGAVGNWHSTIYLAPLPTSNYDVWSWSETGTFTSMINFAVGAAGVSTIQEGPVAIGLSYIGDRSAPANVIIYHFYDRNDEIALDWTSGFWIKGQLVKTGDILNKTNAYTRDSMYGRLRCFQCGATGLPVMEFYGQGSNGGSDIEVLELSEYAYWSECLSIHNDGSQGLRGYHIWYLRCEGIQNNTDGLAVSAVHIGSSTALGAVTKIHIDEAQITNTYFGQYGVLLDGNPAVNNTAGSTINDFAITGAFDGGSYYGGGVDVKYGQRVKLNITNAADTGPVVTVGPSANAIFCCVAIDAGGTENTLQVNMDSSSYSLVRTPSRNTPASNVLQ